MYFEMARGMIGQYGFFDAGTSEPGSLSLLFQPNVLGISWDWDWANERASLSLVNTSRSALFPRHRTWSGGLLFTLPDA